MVVLRSFLHFKPRKKRFLCFFLLSVLRGLYARGLLAFAGKNCQTYCSTAAVPVALNTIVTRLRSASWAAPHNLSPSFIVASGTSARIEPTSPGFEVGGHKAWNLGKRFDAGPGVGGWKGWDGSKFYLNQNDPLRNTSERTRDHQLKAAMLQARKLSTCGGHLEQKLSQ